jgi:hypothetical protein
LHTKRGVWEGIELEITDVAWQNLDSTERAVRVFQHFAELSFLLWCRLLVGLLFGRRFHGAVVNPEMPIVAYRPQVLREPIRESIGIGDRIKDADLLFSSYRKKGEQPRFGSMIVEDYIRPALSLPGYWKNGTESVITMVKWWAVSDSTT